MAYTTKFGEKILCHQPLCHSITHSNEWKNRKKSRFSCSVNLQAPPPLVSAPPLPVPRSHQRHSLSTVSCVSEAERKRTLPARPPPPSPRLGLSFPREHSCWNLRFSATSTPLLFHSRRTYFT